MERLLHYVWKHRLYEAQELVTTDNIPVSVIDTGIENTDSGPDFFNAKIKIGETIWAGNVEMHDKASDWIKHKHNTNKAYDSVILHLVEASDTTIKRTNGEIIPQVLLKAPEHVRRNIEWLLSRDNSLPCISYIKGVEPIMITSWINALLCERMNRKTKDIHLLLEKYNNNWNNVFYIILSRSFGFGINSDAFEQLAQSLPYEYIQEQRNNHSHIEAMMFGQAGMLEENIDSYYYQLLQQEYKFLHNKYSLQPLDLSQFRNMRTRPANFPHIRIAQLAAILVKYDALFSVILEEKDPEKIKKLLRIAPSYYWNTHYHFSDKRQTAEAKLIAESSLNILLINAVVPVLFAYGQKSRQMEYCERSTSMLESLPAENNQIVSTFTGAGISVKHAGDSQAVIQLKREYCEKKRCLYCRIGFSLLKQKNKQ